MSSVTNAAFTYLTCRATTMPPGTKGYSIAPSRLNLTLLYAGLWHRVWTGEELYDESNVYLTQYRAERGVSLSLELKSVMHGKFSVDAAGLQAAFLHTNPVKLLPVEGCASLLTIANSDLGRAEYGPLDEQLIRDIDSGIIHLHPAPLAVSGLKVDIIDFQTTAENLIKHRPWSYLDEDIRTNVGFYESFRNKP